MSQTILFLSVDDLKENTTLNYNIEDKIVEGSIIDAQNIDIQAIIGTTLYEKLLNMVLIDDISGNTSYKTLLESYIIPTQIKFAFRRSLISVYAKATNKSVSTQTSDNSNPVDITILDKMRNEILDDCEFYSNRLKSYLYENQTDFPEYLNPNPNSRKDVIYPNKCDTYFSGIHVNNAWVGQSPWWTKQ